MCLIHRTHTKMKSRAKCGDEQVSLQLRKSHFNWFKLVVCTNFAQKSLHDLITFSCVLLFELVISCCLHLVCIHTCHLHTVLEGQLDLIIRALRLSNRFI